MFRGCFASGKPLLQSHYMLTPAGDITEFSNDHYMILLDQLFKMIQVNIMNLNPTITSFDRKLVFIFVRRDVV